MSPVLLLITDHPAVRQHAAFLPGDVARVPHVGAARRWLAEQEFAADPAPVGMVAWGSDVLQWAEGPLVHRQLRGVPQVALRVPGAPKLSAAGLLGVLGQGARIVPFPMAITPLSEEVWGSAKGSQAA